MESMRNLLLLVVVVAIAAVGGYFFYTEVIDNDDDEDTTEETNDNEDNDDATEEVVVVEDDVVDLAIATPDLSTLVDAVTAANLVTTLQGDGPFTVLAPTNAAFADIQETVDTLLLPENQADLVGVLQYHVISGDVMSGDLTDGMEVETLNGTLTVVIEDGNVFFEDATGGRSQVVTADVEASNGVVHIIDRVLLQ